MQIFRIGSTNPDEIRAAFRWPDLEDENPSKQCGNLMLALLDALDNLATETTKWGYYVAQHSQHISTQLV